jgi:hypothetical protein
VEEFGYEQDVKNGKKDLLPILGLA